MPTNLQVVLFVLLKVILCYTDLRITVNYLKKVRFPVGENGLLRFYVSVGYDCLPLI